MAVVGPGAVVDSEIRPDPILQGVGIDKIVTIHNPLDDDFAIMVGVSKPVEVPVQVSNPADKGQTKLDDSYLIDNYGISLKNASHQSRKHFTNQSIIKAGKTMNFTGDVAQVAVRQLVDELMQKNGDTKLLADPVKRNQYENQVVKSVRSYEDFMNGAPQSVPQQVQEALNKSNDDSSEQSGGSEVAFPDLIPSEQKRRGRPPKDAA